MSIIGGGCGVEHLNIGGWGVVLGGSAPKAMSADGTKGAHHPLMPAWKVFTKPTSAATKVINSYDQTKELHTFTESLSNILSQE